MISNIQNGGFAHSAINKGMQIFNFKSFKTNFNKQMEKTPYYAKEGEPIYKKDMDYDEDGIVDFDELKKYCEENNISKEDINQMLKNWLIYHASKDVEEKSKEIKEDDKKHGDFEIYYSKKGDSKYDEKMDKNNDSKVSYKEYTEYCEKNFHPKENKEKEENNENTSEDLNIKMALNHYSMQNESKIESLILKEA